ncbi:hypothetical protein ODJ80_11240 [Acutalibacter sp. LFL-21]|uniref:hypothetical protein n=1 Tax=Acutalibacter sp. LFL-21 TaxID=2983399 RepID=UPI0021D67BA9|nr:hypothetical protein [Acutalibacter sp. LFL-21]MCU7653373.1 hypothetical protein [Acutalibacter sp. LFL-21]
MPDLSTQQLKELFDQYGADLFALCYLQAGRPAQALDLMAAALCDMAANPRLWAQAASPREGFFRAAYLNCLDNSLRRPKRRKKKKDSPLEEVPRALPFTLTDPLRQVMKLRLAHKAALFCRERLGLSGEESARVLGTSPLRAQRLAESALKKAGITQGQARANLEALAPGEDNLERVWEEFLDQQGRGGFAARQRCRRARRFLDAAMPYLALGVVAVCAAAYLGVEYGWFGAPYTPTQPIEGVITQEGYDGDSAVSLPIETGDVSVFVPEEGGFAEYIVHNTPYSPEDILRQMVLLGGAPEGTTLLSANLDSGGTESSDGSTVTYTLGDTLSLTLEFSQEAASLSGEEGERMLQAMAATFAAYTQGLDQLSIRCQGEELTVNGKTAQDFLGGQLTITRTAETDYRE